MKNFNFNNLKKRAHYNVESIYNGLVNSNVQFLSSAITLIESESEQQINDAKALTNLCLQQKKDSLRIAISGIPGVGKSTFIDQLGRVFIEKGHKVAVLAIDPTSEENNGSILGDKTRMTFLSTHKNAFIRPSATGKNLGGVGKKTRETIQLCETAGYDIIIIETVGVGQSETYVKNMTDLFILLTLPNAGDELQGIKRGIMESADLILVNKCTDHPEKAKITSQQIKNALHFFPLKESKIITSVIQINSLPAFNINIVYQSLLKLKKELTLNGYFKQNRTSQLSYWLRENIQQELLQDFFNNTEIQKKYKSFLNKIKETKESPYTMAKQLIKIYKDGNS